MAKFDHGNRGWRALAARFRAECEQIQATCWMCGQDILYDEDSTSHPDAFHVDHMFPVSKYPELAMDPANLRASHRSCNMARGDKDPLPGLGFNSRKW